MLLIYKSYLLSSTAHILFYLSFPQHEINYLSNTTAASNTSKASITLIAYNKSKAIHCLPQHLESITSAKHVKLLVHHS